MPVNPANVRLEVQLGRLRLANPVTVASGTFGYAREMAGFVDISRLGGILPKTITQQPRPGNPPPRTVETTGGMLNSIGLDNDGLDAFLERQLPYLASLRGKGDSPIFADPRCATEPAKIGTVPTLGTAVIVSIAGKSCEEYVDMAARLDDVPGVDALELNLSCPNVSHGVDFGTNPALCEKVVSGVRGACRHPILAKLTPNVTDVTEIAKAAEAGGADALSLINTCLGMAVNWRRRKPILGNVLGGLSGPAIKPIALRIVYQVSKAVKIPLVGIGGIATIDDVMDFLVAGAMAVQIGTANFYNPTASMQILDALPTALAELGASSVAEVVGTLER
jgi:dihydroorotate dehydrogenase (NAD+) catalytic subunit